MNQPKVPSSGFRWTQTFLRWALALTTSLAAACGETSTAPRPAPAGDGFVRVRLPEGVTASDLQAPSRALRQQLDFAVASRAASLGSAPSDLIVYEAADGTLVLPDASRAPAQASA